MKEIQEAQLDMRKGYADGSLGIIVSGTIWLVSGFAIQYFSARHGIWTLIIGGMFIFPLSVLLAKILRLPGKHQQTNPFGTLAMEGTIWMIMCIPLAYGLSLQNTAWFFQGMLLIIGGRYLTFATIYGQRWYWLLGGLLGLSAYALFSTKSSALLSAFTGGIIEIAFGVFALVRFRRSRAS